MSEQRKCGCGRTFSEWFITNDDNRQSPYELGRGPLTMYCGDCWYKRKRLSLADSATHAAPTPETP